MYNRRTKIFFGFMVLVMGIGYPLSLLAGTSAFSSLLGGSNSASGQTRKLVTDARKDVLRLKCKDVADKPSVASKSRRSSCADALRKLASGYIALGAPTTDAKGATSTPADSDADIDKAITAYLLWAKVDPSDDTAQRGLGSAYLQRSLPKKAEAVFAALAKANPSNPDYLFQYAQVAAQASDTAVSIAQFKRFIKENPDDTNVEQAKAFLAQLQQPAHTATPSVTPTAAPVKTKTATTKK